MRSILAALLLLSLASLPVVAASTTVDIAAADGVTLKATHVSPGRPGPGVLLLHMCNSDRSAWSGLAELLAARGIHSLALDYRGFGDSGGERPTDNPQAQRTIRAEKWPGDIDAAFAFLRSRPGVDGERLAAAGGSCGVDNSVQLARRHRGEVKALVLLAGTTDDAGEKFLATNPWLPILASASHDDGQAVELTRWTMGFSGHAHNRFLEYEVGGHGTEMFAVHDDLEPQIADWLEQQLVERPVKMPIDVRAKAGPSAEIWTIVNEEGGVARLRERVRAARAAGETLRLPPEVALNAEGYRRITAGDPASAVDIFRLNVEAFPTSANALDSLGDAYLAAGNLEQAAEFARRAIAAIEDDPSLGADFADAVRRSAENKLALAAGKE